MSWKLFPIVVMIAIPMVSHCAARTPVASMSPSAEFECGEARIVAMGAEFRDALVIEYTVEFGRGRYCIPDLDYDGSVLHAWAVELVRAEADPAPTARLETPLDFQRVPRWRKRVNPLGGIQKRQVAAWGPRGFRVPPGEYRLVLKYRAGNCRGRAYATVCVVSSDMFRLEKAVDFAVER